MSLLLTSPADDFTWSYGTLYHCTSSLKLREASTVSWCATSSAVFIPAATAAITATSASTHFSLSSLYFIVCLGVIDTLQVAATSATETDNLGILDLSPEYCACSWEIRNSSALVIKVISGELGVPGHIEPIKDSND